MDEPDAQEDVEGQGKATTNANATIAQALDVVDNALDRTEETTTGTMQPHWAAERQKDDVVVSIGPSRYPLPSQSDGWQIPATMREYALAILWRVMRSPQTKHIIKIRAIETLIRLDGQVLNVERHDDWRKLQAGKNGRANVRVLADLVDKADKSSKTSKQ